MLAASFHYFRRPPRFFGRALAAIRSLGFDSVESPVPWSEHESSGRFAFDSDTAHLGAFLEEAGRIGLGAHLRLGPCVGAELTCLGLPRSVASDPATAAGNAAGRPLVVPIPPRWMLAPSYASRAYRERSAGWIRAACAAIAPWVAPRGPVLSVAVGDVVPYLGRSPVAPADQSPDAVEAYEAARAELRPAERDRLMPADRSAPPASADAAIGAMLFAERLYLDYVAGLAAAAAEHGCRAVATTLPPAGLFHPVGAGLLASSFERLGLDVYGWAGAPRPLDRDLRLLAGSVRRPFASLVAAGTPPWLPHLGPADNLHGLRACLAAGLDGIVVSPAVAHDRWAGGLLDERLRESSDPAQAVRKLVHGVARSGWLDMRPRPAAAIVLPRDYVRAALGASASVLGPLSPCLPAALGFPPTLALDPADDDPSGGAWWSWFEAAERALEEAGAPWVIVDDESPVDVDAAATPLLLVPALAAAPAATLRRVRSHLERGGVVVAGPRRPVRDIATREPIAALPAAAVFVERPDVAVVTEALRAAGLAEAAPGDGVERRLLADPRGKAARGICTGPGDARAPRGVAIVNRSAGAVPAARAAPAGEWRDLDEPGVAPAGGVVRPGAIRLLVRTGGGRAG